MKNKESFLTEEDIKKIRLEKEEEGSEVSEEELQQILAQSEATTPAEITSSIYGGPIQTTMGAMTIPSIPRYAAQEALYGAVTPGETAGGRLSSFGEKLKRAMDPTDPTSLVEVSSGVPSLSEIAGEVGVPPGPSLYGITPRGAAGFVLESMLDVPAGTAFSKGISQGVRGAKIAKNRIGNLTTKPTLDEDILYPKLKSLKETRMQKAVGDTNKVLGRYASISEVDKLYDMDRLSRRAISEGLDKYMDNPETLYNVVAGTEKTNAKDVLGLTNIGREKVGGRIAKHAREVDDFLVNADEVLVKNNLGDILPTKSELVDNAFNKLDTALKESASGLLPHEREVLKARMTAIVGEAAEGVNPNLDSYMSLKEMNDLKRKIYRPSKDKTWISGDLPAESQEAARKILIQSLEEAIEDSLGAPEAYSMYRTMNQRIGDLIQLKEILPNDALKKIQEPSGAARVGSAISDYAIAGGVASAVGLPPEYAAGWTAIRDARRYGGSGIRDMFDNQIAKMSIAKANNPFLADTFDQSKRLGAIGMAQQHYGPEGERNPQGSFEPLQRILNPIDPEMLSNTPIPRTTQGVLENKEFVKMKIASVAPQFAESVARTLDTDPHAVAEMLPVIAQQFPQIFQRDPYNRINGKIYDPQLKAKARKDIIQNREMTASEKALRLSTLNETGYLEGEL